MAPSKLKATSHQKVNDRDIWWLIVIVVVICTAALTAFCLGLYAIPAHGQEADWPAGPEPQNPVTHTPCCGPQDQFKVSPQYITRIKGGWRIWLEDPGVPSRFKGRIVVVPDNQVIWHTGNDGATRLSLYPIDGSPLCLFMWSAS